LMRELATTTISSDQHGSGCTSASPARPRRNRAGSRCRCSQSPSLGGLHAAMLAGSRFAT
jgi:hypothetical protein